MDVAKKKLLRFPVFVIIHIALVTVLFKIVYPEVDMSSLPIVIGGAGFCLAFITDYLYRRFFSIKDKEQCPGEKIDENK